MKNNYKLTAQDKKNLLRQGFSEEDIRHLEIISDPVLWAEQYLRNPDNAKEPLDLRFYQKEMIRYQDGKKVYRAGRRIGKSICLCIEMLWKAFTNADKNILVCAPYKTQVANLWKDGFNKLIKGNPLIESAIAKQRANPHEIIFHNGSRILGLTAGSSTGNKGTSIRGMNADYLFLDEVDYMGDEAIQSILAIIATKKDTHFTISSTPSGKREFFYEACKNKALGYKEFHYPSSDSPEWLSIEECEKKDIPIYKSQEFLFRNSNPESVYQHEYEAEFGSEEQGVFKHHFVDSSLIIYPKDKQVADSKGKTWFCGDEQKKENVYSMGVDWNGDRVGTQIVITEYARSDTSFDIMIDNENGLVKDMDREEMTMRNQYRLFYRESVAINEMTQLTSIQRIIELNKKFKIDHIYVDSGFGTTNIEELKLYGMKYRESGILSKLKNIDFQGTLYVYDPYTKEQIKKQTKPFMVNNAVTCLERKEILLPTAEDEKIKLVGQMREYRVERFSPTGVPTYSSKNDHILDAFMLSLLAFQIEYSELVKVKYSEKVEMTSKPSLLISGITQFANRTNEKKENTLDGKYGIPKREQRLNADEYHSDSRGNHMDYEDLMKKDNNKTTVSPFSPSVKRTSWSRAGAPSRSSF